MRRKHIAVSRREVMGGQRVAGHCEDPGLDPGDEAIQEQMLQAVGSLPLDCFAALAMTGSDSLIVHPGVRHSCARAALRKRTEEDTGRQVADA